MLAMAVYKHRLEGDCTHIPLHSCRDVIGRAITGSGKTLAFALPIVHILSKRCICTVHVLVLHKYVNTHIII